jgi:hypothetical protein
MAIKAFLIFNNKSQIRLVSIYAPLAAPVQTALVRRIQARVFSSGTDGTAAAASSSRRQTGTELPDAEADSNFLDASDLAQVFEPRAEEDEEAQGRKEVLEEERDGSGDGDGWLLVWRNYATLYFVCVVDGSESPLGILDLIQVRACRVSGEAATESRGETKKLGLCASSAGYACAASKGLDRFCLAVWAQTASGQVLATHASRPAAQTSHAAPG